MEELVGNASGARQVFERWMEWEPTEEAWMAFAKFEMRLFNILTLGILNN